MAEPSQELSPQTTCLANVAPALPPEIINLIMDELEHDPNRRASIQALRSCVLVCRGFCRRAYSISKFSEIKLSVFLSSNSTNTRPQKLLDILETSLNFPDLGMVYYIRSASFIFELESWYFIRGTISYDPTFPRILDALHGPSHGISSFSLEINVAGKTGNNPIPEWSSNGPKFNKAFHNLCCSRGLTILHLTHFTHVPRAILRGTQIKHLNLKDVDFAHARRYTEEGYPGSGDNIQPESITYIGQWWFPTLLTVLECNRESSLTHRSRFHLAFANLKDLTITAQNRRAYLYLMPQLRSLRLLNLSVYHTIPSQIFYAINEFFSHPKNTIPSSLQHLAVEVKAGTYVFTGSLGRRDMQQNNPQWNGLDLHLAGSQFLNVQDILLVIHFGSDHGAAGNQPSDEPAFIEENRGIVLNNLPRVVALRPTTFLLDINIDDKSFNDVRGRRPHADSEY